MYPSTFSVLSTPNGKGSSIKYVSPSVTIKASLKAILDKYAANLGMRPIPVASISPSSTQTFAAWEIHKSASLKFSIKILVMKLKVFFAIRQLPHDKQKGSHL